jgi:hypothetical protein
MKKYVLIIGLLILFINAAMLNAQSDTVLLDVPSSAAIDTNLAIKKLGTGFFAYSEDNLPIPKKSLIYSFILPGMGQAYNRRWWKLPLVGAAVGGIVYAIDFNQRTYRDFRDALEQKLKDEPHKFTGTTIDSESSLRSLRDRYDRYTQMSYMGAIGVYAVIAIESFVDGHLQSFDISDDLSLQVKPSFDIDPIFARPTVGVSFVMVID